MLIIEPGKTNLNPSMERQFQKGLEDLCRGAKLLNIPLKELLALVTKTYL